MLLLLLQGREMHSVSSGDGTENQTLHPIHNNSLALASSNAAASELQWTVLHITITLYLPSCLQHPSHRSIDNPGRTSRRPSHDTPWYRPTRRVKNKTQVPSDCSSYTSFFYLLFFSDLYHIQQKQPPTPAPPLLSSHCPTNF